MLAHLIATYRTQRDRAVAAMITAAAARVPAFAARIAAAGVDPTTVRSAEDLARLPVFTKDQLLAAQRADPPFGGLVAADAPIARVFVSPGPLYEPQLAGGDPWHWAAAVRATGIGPGDRVLNCFSYHFSPAGAMLEEGCLAAGATVIPAGVGNQELQVQVAAELGATAYVGLPSYLKALVEKSAERGVGWTIRRALVTAEPLPDSLRAWFAPHISTVLQAYGTAEAGLLGHETAPRSGLAIPDDVLIEICDLDTGASRLDDGIGQVVVTRFNPAAPLVRFGTGDLSAWTTGPDGSLRLSGVLGRTGEAVKVRGLFLHPRQAAAALAPIAAVVRHRFVVRRADHQDTLRCELVLAAGADEVSVAQAVRDQIRAALRLGAEVACVATLPDGPTIIDERDWK